MEPKGTSPALDRIEPSMHKVCDHITAVTAPIEDTFDFDKDIMGLDFKGNEALANVMTRLGAVNWHLVKIILFIGEQPFALDNNTREKTISFLKALLPMYPVPKSGDADTMAAAEALGYAQQRIASWIADLEAERDGK